MVRVVTHSDVEAVGEGGTLAVPPDAIVTPLAEERARARGVRIVQESGPAPALVQSVARQVVARLGDASPQVLEAVVAEVVSALGDGLAVGGRVEVGPGIDFCQMCVERERARRRRRAVLTTTGKNTKGIVARVTTRIAELGGDILDISQTIVGDYFTMIIVIDTGGLEVAFSSFKEAVEAEVKAMGLECMMMHEDVVQSLHRV